MTGHVNEMLGEVNNLPISIPADPEHRGVSGIPSKTEKNFDWPNNLIDHIMSGGIPRYSEGYPGF